jgi:hypothetical protein
MRRIRYRIDSTTITAYDSITAYSQYNFVMHNGHLYKMIDNESGVKATP